MALRKLDAHLCELKELQIRDGLHVFGRSPEGELLTDLLVALARVPRGAATAAMPRCCALWRRIWALATSIRSDCDLAEPWTRSPPAALRPERQPWRSAGDTVERLERAGPRLVAGADRCRTGMAADPRRAGLRSSTHLRPRSPPAATLRLAGLLARARRALRASPARPARRRAAGPRCCRPAAISIRSTPAPCRRRPPGSLAGNRRRCCSSAISRNTATGRGACALSAWGTANMRTGGDDIAQALALIGVRPVWDARRGRVTGFEIMPASSTRPAAGRCDPAHFRLFPRRLPGPDRARATRRCPRRRGARRAADDQPARRRGCGRPAQAGNAGLCVPTRRRGERGLPGLRLKAGCLRGRPAGA